MTLRNLSRSSILGRGARVTSAIFSSAAEFVGLLEESIQEQTERLADAKQRQLEMREELEGSRLVRGWRGGTSKNIEYAESKIKKQEEKVANLETHLHNLQQLVDEDS